MGRVGSGREAHGAGGAGRRGGRNRVRERAAGIQVWPADRGAASALPPPPLRPRVVHRADGEAPVGTLLTRPGVLKAGPGRGTHASAPLELSAEDKWKIPILLSNRFFAEVFFAKSL